MSGSGRLDWRGPEVRALVVTAVGRGLTKSGLAHEGAAKGRLVKGQGVITGTLRRSIHSAGPQYPWAGDNVRPSSSTPERGGSPVDVVEQNSVLAITTGSGLRYARKINDRYGYLTDTWRDELPRLPGRIEAEAKNLGLK